MAVPVSVVEHHHPTKADIAVRAGLSVERLEKLLFTARMPLSLQKPVFLDQDTTFQVIFITNFFRIY